MVVLAALLVGVGLLAVVGGLLASRSLVSTAPTAVDVALGVAVPPAARKGKGGADAAMAEEDEPPLPPFLYRVLEPMFGVGSALVGRVSPAGRIDLLGRRIVQAGLEGRLTAERVLGYQALGALCGVALGVLLPHGSVPFWLWLPFVGLIGFFVPDVILSRKADERQQDIGRALPEALDLLAITVEAGLGLEQAIQTVCENLEGPLGDELARLLREIELGVSRREALAALRSRVAVAELSAFVVALIQADQMGVAIADVLKVQAAQVRIKRRQHAREQAAKAPVKILFPVIFGVLPSLFIVTLGPAAISIVTAFSNK